MVEFLDNLTQLRAALSGCVLAGVFYLRSRRQYASGERPAAAV